MNAQLFLRNKTEKMLRMNILVKKGGGKQKEYRWLLTSNFALSEYFTTRARF